MRQLLLFSLSGRVELLKYIYFYARKSIINAGNNKFQDLINVPRMLGRDLTKSPCHNISKVLIEIAVLIKLSAYNIHFI